MMRSLICPLEPAARRVSVIRRDGARACVDADRMIAATMATIRHVALSEHHRRMIASRGDPPVNAKFLRV